MKGIKVLQIFSILICACIAYYVYELSEDVKQLHQENEVLWNKLDSLQHSPALTVQSKGKSASKPTTLIDYLVSESEKSERAARAEEARKKIAVTASYRLEDRYVPYKVELPELRGNSEGTIVLDVTVKQVGTVVSAKLNSSTITDEDVIEAAKKAALQTDFNCNFDAPDTQQGTITYTYKKK